MKQETILKRDDGNKVMIEVSAYMDRYIDGKIVYSITVWEAKQLHLKYVSEEEINQAKLALWQKMKPT